MVQKYLMPLKAVIKVFSTREGFVNFLSNLPRKCDIPQVNTRLTKDEVFLHDSTSSEKGGSAEKC